MEIGIIVILTIINVASLVAIAVGYARIVWLEKHCNQLEDWLDYRATKDELRKTQHEISLLKDAINNHLSI